METKGASKLKKRHLCKTNKMDIKKNKKTKLEDFMNRYSVAELQVIALGTWCLLFVMVFFIVWALFKLINAME